MVAFETQSVNLCACRNAEHRFRINKFDYTVLIVSINRSEFRLRRNRTYLDFSVGGFCTDSELNDVGSSSNAFGNEFDVSVECTGSVRSECEFELSLCICLNHVGGSLHSDVVANVEHCSVAVTPLTVCTVEHFCCCSVGVVDSCGSRNVVADDAQALSFCKLDVLNNTAFLSR